MKRRGPRQATGAALILALLLSACTGQEQNIIGVGDKVPALALMSLAGTEHELAQKGQATWVSFWASWCAPCRAEWPDLQKAQPALARDGIKLVAINVNETAADVQAFLAEHPARFEVGLDPEGATAARFGVIGFPTHVLIGESGVVQVVVRGPLSADRARRLLSMEQAN